MRLNISTDHIVLNIVVNLHAKKEYKLMDSQNNCKTEYSNQQLKLKIESVLNKSVNFKSTNIVNFAMECQ